MPSRTLILRYFIIALAFALGCMAEPSRGQETPELSAAAVRQAIDKGVSFLRNTQMKNGQWNEMNLYEGGVTALVALSLLNCGVPTTDPDLARALKLLETQGRDRMTVYVASLRLMAFTAADPQLKRYGRLVQEDAEYLLKLQVKGGPYVGGWSYGITMVDELIGQTADSSNSQFALLGLHEAARVGFQVPRDVWIRARQYWQNSHDAGRGWFAYSPRKDRPNGSMTCAGISSLVICDENLADPDRYLKGGRVNCCQPPGDQRLIQNGIRWLADNFTVTSNPSPDPIGREGKYYYLYGMERAGRMSGQRFIGPFDWYREGAAHLVKDQGFDGSWQRDDRFGMSRDINTAFALLFLSKGKRPIVFGKYQYGDDQNWDLHPPGIHYLTRETEKAWQLPLNWQTVDGNTAEVNDLLEAPVLFISGQEAISLNAEQKKRLKSYVENGGFLFVEACQGDGCGTNVPFDASFRALMAELFPDSQLEPLPPEHPVWSANFPIKPDPERPLLGLQACCRTSVIYCPRNLSCYWQLDRPNFLSAVSKDIVEEITYCRQIGINVAAYATSRELNDKLERPKLAAGVNVELLKDRFLELPKLRHNGGADEAPNAWNNLLQDFRSQTQMNLVLEKKLIEPTFDQLADHPFVFLHGRSRFSFDPQQREELRKYLQRGGFLFADSICGAREFTDAFRAEFKQILPDNPLEPIAADHPIWQDERYGYNLTQSKVTLNTPDRNAPGGFTSQQVAPQLEGIEIDGRLAVVFSPVDLSCALENASATQCRGYSRDSAIKIGTNVILYRLRVD